MVSAVLKYRILTVKKGLYQCVYRCFDDDNRCNRKTTVCQYDLNVDHPLLLWLTYDLHDVT